MGQSSALGCNPGEQPRQCVLQVGFRNVVRRIWESHNHRFSHILLGAEAYLKTSCPGARNSTDAANREAKCQNTWKWTSQHPGADMVLYRTGNRRQTDLILQKVTKWEVLLNLIEAIVRAHTHRDSTSTRRTHCLPSVELKYSKME